MRDSDTVFEAYSATGRPSIRVVRRSVGGTPQLVLLCENPAAKVFGLRRAWARGMFALDPRPHGLVVDFLPSNPDTPTNPVPTSRDFVAVTASEVVSGLGRSDWVVTRLTFAGSIRCYLGGIPGDAVHLWADLDVAAGPELRWHRLVVNGRDLDLARRLGPDQGVDLPSGSRHPFLDAVGLRSVERSTVRVGFAAAFMPAAADITDEDPDEQLYAESTDDTYVLQFQQSVSLSRAIPGPDGQRLTADKFFVALSNQDVERAELHLADRNSPLPSFQRWPLKLVQTHAAIDEDAGPAAVLNDWVVRVVGLPAAAVVPAYNRLAEAYHATMRAVDDGRPVSGVPQLGFTAAPELPDEPPELPPVSGVPQPGFTAAVANRPEPYDRVWDPVELPAASDDAKKCERELYRPWLLTFNATDNRGVTIGLETLAEVLRQFRSVRLRAGFPVGPDIASLVAYRMWFLGLARHDYHEPADRTLLSPEDAGVATLDCAILRPKALFAKLQASILSPGPRKALVDGRGYPTPAATEVESIWRGLWFQFDRLFPVAPDATGKAGPPQRLRVGALDLELAGTMMPLPARLFDGRPDRGDELKQWRDDLFYGESNETVGLDRRRSLVAVGLRVGHGQWADPIPAVVLDVRLRVEHAEPGGQDGLPNEPFSAPSRWNDTSPATQGDSSTAVRARFVRESPVLVPLGRPARRPMLLRIRERTTAAQSRRLAMQLFGWGPTVGRDIQPLVVIDRQPFLIAKVWAPPLAGLTGTDGNLEVGNWSATNGFEGASWELAGATGGFVVHLPPQAVGEGAEKRRGADIADDEVVPSRLGPPTRLELAASFFRQNFVEATWNLRRILGYPGQRAPGAGIRRMDFELLYGMGCTVRVEGLRLTELEALLGAVPGRLPQRQTRPLGSEVDFHDQQDAAFGRLNSRWSRVYATYSSRLGVYLPNLATQSQGLTLRDGVDYLLRDPEPLMQDPTKPLTVAQGGGKLPGGALWGLEFESAYRPFRTDAKARKATAAELARPALSALGGWGYQKAVFQDGLTTIYSDTAMGRTFFYSVERRGRIAGFYNYAKHVVVYERTVGTTLQFRDEQDHHAGRPILRKVREFVELIQPVRRYPDLGDAEVTRGFVLGIDFKSKVIPVSSSWGRDVPGPGGDPVGYVIPLWRADADPAAYPKPQAILTLAGAGGNGEQLPCTLDEPQRLLFFSAAEAAAAAGTSGAGDDFNTDRWPAFAGVDFPDLPWPTTPGPSVNPGDNIEAPLPDEESTAAGYEAYTHPVTASAAANLVTGRTDELLGTLVRNVTMVRANPLQPTNGAAGAAGVATNAGEHALELRKRMTKSQALLSSLQSAAAKPLADPANRRAIDATLAAIGQELAGVPANFTGVFGAQPPKVANWDARLPKSLLRWQKQAADAARRTLDELPETLARFNTAATIADEVKRDALHAVLDACDQYRLALPPADGGLTDILNRLQAALGLPAAAMRQFEQAVNGVVGEVDGLLDGLLGDVVLDPALRTRVQAAGVRFTDAAARALRRAVEPLVAGLVDNLPAIVSDRVTEALGTADRKLAEFATGWRQAAGGTVDDIYDALATLDTTWSNVDTALSKAIDDAASADLTVANAADAVAQRLRGLYDIDVVAGSSKLGDLIGEAGLDAFRRQLQDAVQNATTGSALVRNVTSRLNGLRDLRGRLGAVAKAAPLAAFAGQLQADVALLSEVTPQALAAKAAALTGLSTTVQDLDQLKSQLDEKLGALRSEIDRVGNNIVSGILDKFPAGVVQTAGNTLRLVRAFGDAPNVTGMVFNRARLGYFFLPEKARAGLPVDMTAATALVNRSGGQLKGLGIALPSGQLLDRVVPPELTNFDFGKLLPDFAGLKLDNLLPDLKAPAGLADKVKVTSNFDRATGRGWAQADVTIDAAEPTTLFDAGPIKVSLRDVRFRARIRIEAGPSGAPKHTQFGSLASTWDLVFGGTPLVTFLDTELSFDEAGRTRFTLDPTKIEMNGLLAMLSDVLKTVSDPDGGFTLRLKEQNGLPVGVEAILNLPLPDLTFGVCALANLRFGAELELAAVPEFAVGLRVHVGEKMAPVTVAILILAGGCWFDARARYCPLSKRTTTAVSIALNAGAMLAIAFGPVRGCVFAFVFVEGELRTDSADAGSQQLLIRIGLILGGDVDVLGLVTVSIRLVLELEYNGTTGDLVGRGTLSLRIKICWCFTIRVNKTVEKRFVSGGNNRSRALGGSRPDARPRVERACREHLKRTT